MKRIKIFFIGVTIGILITLILTTVAIEVYKFLSNEKTITILKSIGRHIIKNKYIE